jgi:N4-gp56 family major capsid protein
MSDQITGDSDVKSNDLIVAMVQKSLIENSVIAASLMNVSQFAVKGVSDIEFPKRSANFEVKKKVSKVVSEAETITYTTDKLSLDQQAYIKFIIEKKASIQSVVDLETNAILDAAASHAEDMDKYFYSLMFAGAVAKNVAFTGAGTKLALADIVNARQKIKATKVKNFMGNVFLAINSEEEASMLQISDFIDASKYGSNEGVMNGEIGKVFGVKVLVTESVTAGKPVMYHNEALYWGLQYAPIVMRQDDLDNIGEKFLISQLYGGKFMSNSFAVPFNS